MIFFMREAFVKYLTDPLTGGSFQMTVYEKEGDQVLSGILTTGENWYPSIHGIPRIMVRKLRTNLLENHHAFFRRHKEVLPEKAQEEWQEALNNIPNFNTFLNHQKKTAESFAYEWKYIYKENDFEKSNFFHFLSPFLKENDLREKITLDIGCGSGRFTKWAALSGTAISFATDLGESVEVAYAMTKDIPNVCIIQADIYAMPFQQVVDIAYSIGVLHHLPKPQEGFSQLPNVLKIGGQMLIWVYNRRNNARALYFYEPLLALLKKLSKPLLFKLCYIPGGIVHAINIVSLKLQKLGLIKTAHKMPFSYYENFPFNMKLNDAFDVLATPKSNYYYSEEIVRWFTAAKLKDIQVYEHPEAGITCIGTYGP
jgi:SAM-dependent methyltransferase